MNIQKQLDYITNEAKTALGENLRSLVLYGSHARGDAHAKSDINLLVIVNDLSPEKLRALAKAVPGWMKLRVTPPVVFSREQFLCSMDSFALEFTEMAAARTVLAGDDPFLSYSADWAAVRRELEQEARQKRIEVYRRWLAAGGNPKHYPTILRETFPGFLSLIRGTALLMREKLEPVTLKAALDELEQHPWFKSQTWATVARSVHEGKTPSGSELVTLMDNYLAQTAELVMFLDKATV